MTTLRMGMVGGGRDAFIGAVHRAAARLAGGIDFVAGALSSTPQKSIASGRDLGLAEERCYPTWQAMLEGESERDDRIDFVSIVTPNDSHHAIAASFLQSGFHVVCDKPLTTEIDQAEHLARLVRDTGRVFAVTYNYSGYPMIREARRLVADGALGEIRKVIVEYHQGWLAERIELGGQKQAEWRTDPARSGVGGAIGDIGSHCEQLVRFVTGLEIESLSALLTRFAPGRALDDDANVLLKFAGGARGVLSVSQIATGCRNELRLRVWGTEAGLDWSQENPNHLLVRPHGAPERVHHRGEGYATDDAKAVTVLPTGHPEAFHDAFANIYRNAAAAMRGATDAVYPPVDDGLSGVRFIHAVVRSDAQGGAWVAPR